MDTADFVNVMSYYESNPGLVSGQVNILGVVVTTTSGAAGVESLQSSGGHAQIQMD